MATAREIMTPVAECVGENETLEVAAQKMRDPAVGMLPICGEDNRLKGVIADRDIVVKCLPVIDGHDLVGMVAQADTARSLPEDQVGELVKLISF